MSEHKKTNLTATEDWSLEEHDRIYHPGGYKKGDKCKVRERLEKSDDADFMLFKAGCHLGSERSLNERKPLSGDNPNWKGVNSLWRTGNKSYSPHKKGKTLNDTDKEAFKLAYEKARASGDRDFELAARRMYEDSKTFSYKDILEGNTKIHGELSGNGRGMVKAIKAFKEARREIGTRKAKKYLDMTGK